VLVIVAPGQGAQTPGFLSPWLELPGFRDRMQWLSVCAGMDLVRLGTEGSAEEVTDTAVAQPLLVSSGMVTLLALFPHPSDAYGKVGAGAGHSVGEITAAAAAGVITAEQAMIFVRERGRAMARAAAAQPTGMTAVLGGEPEQVLSVLDKHGLTPANINAAGQVVAAGTMGQLAALAADPPESARLRPLAVAGAFHTRHMEPAVDHLRSLSRAISTHDPRLRLLSNRDGAVVHHGRDVLTRIVDQVANPVRWDLCMRTMADFGATALLELPPAGTLSGLAKRALPGIETLALKSPDDLPAAADLIARHATSSPISESPSWRMLVAPSKGVFRYAEGVGGLGDELEPGTTVGTVEGLRDSAPVIAPHGGTIVEWLVEEGDPVSPGQPIIRLHPVEVPA
jgi:[acyl-carrier-protein] S-malonyltransferase